MLPAKQATTQPHRKIHHKKWDYPSDGHGCRSSLYRAQSTALSNAFRDEKATADNMPLSQLREGEEDHRYLLTPAFTQTVRFFCGTTTNVGAIGTRTVGTASKKPENNVKAFFVPNEDQHFSEYPAHSDERRAFISGFNGSAGCAIITLRDAFLFTDGRYFLQASQQLDSNWKFMKQGLPDIHLEHGTRIGIDPTLISAAADVESLKKSLKPLQQNPVDIVWGKDRPPCPHNSIFPLDIKYAGETFQNTPQRLREDITKKNAVASVVTLLDEVAWLFYLRGTDIGFNPVFFASVDVTPMEAILFMNDAQAQHSIKTFLGSDENAVLIPSPVAAMMAIKNKTEIEGFRKCHIRDGAALMRAKLNESQARRIQIIYLYDSGGGSFHFTMIHFSRDHPFTRVLQAHISIDTAVFPIGTSGADSFARRALWQEGWGSYSHGTGHGVGHFLNVREDPHGIGTRIAYNSPSLKAGMTVSNEPGYYADGRYDIRTESVVIVGEAKTPNNFGNGNLCFEHVTISPIQTRLIDFSA
ncbi:peptidase M24, structural domain-containing protein [Suillus placidus]|uniref:Peptidase M24, structural domain-containing protein n=1 Tax=Suillus placidus TaxID=48579 RepID=A0A9P6ZIC2_9AGAM|nr:peptidase M24, structural domain-containing protein [Suillus placidus]